MLLLLLVIRHRSCCLLHKMVALGTVPCQYLKRVLIIFGNESAYCMLSIQWHLWRSLVEWFAVSATMFHQVLL